MNSFLPFRQAPLLLTLTIACALFTLVGCGGTSQTQTEQTKMLADLRSRQAHLHESKRHLHILIDELHSLYDNYHAGRFIASIPFFVDHLIKLNELALTVREDMEDGRYLREVTITPVDPGQDSDSGNDSPSFDLDPFNPNEPHPDTTDTLAELQAMLAEFQQRLAETDAIILSLTDSAAAEEETFNTAIQALTTEELILSTANQQMFDTDFAMATASLVKAQIEQQAATMYLIQTPSMPQNALALLGNLARTSHQPSAAPR